MAVRTHILDKAAQFGGRLSESLSRSLSKARLDDQGAFAVADFDHAAGNQIPYRFL